MSADFKKTAVIGAGVMGGEIAMLISAAGLPVMLKDIDQSFLDAGMEKARALYAFKVKRRRMTQEEMDQKIALISPTLSYDGIEAADVVIEAVTENMAVKKRVFAELGGLCRPDALLTSNTSALSISEMAAATARPERVAGFHFFNPASFMRLVEVIRGEKTSAESIDRLCAFAETIGKTPVRVADSAGFIVNRLLCAAMIEAMRCEAEGLATMEEIDAAVIKPDAGLPTGLYKMADQLGMDLALHVMETIAAAHGGAQRTRFNPPEAIRKLVEKGNLGVKTGKGFYSYG